MNPEDYRPQYDDSVVEFLDNDSRIVNINKAYCLMPTSALVLGSLFSPVPKMFMAPPISQAMGSPFKFNHWVPWLDFGQGITRNAAVLAGYWGMPGVPYNKALDYAKLDVATLVEGQ